MNTERRLSETPAPGASVVAAPGQRAATISTTHRPWWREPMMYLVLGGPAVVVVAAITTGVIAWRGADPVVSEYTDNAARASGQTEPVDASHLPAQKARNHAATLR